MGSTYHARIAAWLTRNILILFEVLPSLLNQMMLKGLTFLLPLTDRLSQSVLPVGVAPICQFLDIPPDVPVFCPFLKT